MPRVIRSIDSDVLEALIQPLLIAAHAGVTSVGIVESECVELFSVQKVQTCSESNSGRPILRSKSTQNDPMTLLI